VQIGDGCAGVEEESVPLVLDARFDDGNAHELRERKLRARQRQLLIGRDLSCAGARVNRHIPPLEPQPPRPRYHISNNKGPEPYHRSGKLKAAITSSSISTNRTLRTGSTT